jgi:hypothetical protein
VTAADRRPQASTGESWGPAQGMNGMRTQRSQAGGGRGAAAPASRPQGQRTAPATAPTGQRGGGGARPRG